MDIKNQGSRFYREYDDGKDYYLKNDHGNILEVNKVIAMERFGYIFTTAKDTATEDRVGMWKKKLPAEEGFQVVTKEEWQKLENERLKITPPPTAKPKMGPDEGRFNPPAGEPIPVKTQPENDNPTGDNPEGSKTSGKKGNK